MLSIVIIRIRHVFLQRFKQRYTVMTIVSCFIEQGVVVEDATLTLDESYKIRTYIIMIKSHMLYR